MYSLFTRASWRGFSWTFVITWKAESRWFKFWWTCLCLICRDILRNQLMQLSHHLGCMGAMQISHIHALNPQMVINFDFDLVSVFIVSLIVPLVYICWELYLNCALSVISLLPLVSLHVQRTSRLTLDLYFSKT